MNVVQNSHVEERQPHLLRYNTDAIFARLLRTPVGSEVPDDPTAMLKAFFAITMGEDYVLEVPNTPLEETKSKGYITHFISRDKVVLPQIFDKPGHLESSNVSLFVQALHAAFAEHMAFSFAPEIAWYLIAHEVAVHVRLNANRYRGYFTTSSDRETIEIRDDSLVYGSPDNAWDRAIDKFRVPLTEKVPQATMQLLLPQFSTSTDESDTALLILFLDIVSNFYDTRLMSSCGIPAIRVEGTSADWQSLLKRAELVQHEFSGLKAYFDDLLPVLREVAGTAAGQEPDPEFWPSLYKYNNGSGGPYINGWITTFFAHKLTPAGFVPRQQFDWRKDAMKDFTRLISANLPAHLSTVPFVWDYRGQKIKMALMAGVMGVEYDGFLNPKLGYGILEERQK